MDKKVSRQFFNTEAAHWDESAGNNDQVKLKDMADRLNFLPNAKVLDVGTGTGVFVPYIRSKLNGKGYIVCVDFAYQMLEIATQKNGYTKVDYVCAEIETVGYMKGIFDAAICYSTFPHFHDKPLAIQNIFDMLTVGGKAYICHTASREFINEIHRKIPDLRDHLIPEKDEMWKMMKKAGFRNISIENESEFYIVTGTRIE